MAVTLGNRGLVAAAAVVKRLANPALRVADDQEAQLFGYHHRHHCLPVVADAGLHYAVGCCGNKPSSVARQKFSFFFSIVLHILLEIFTRVRMFVHLLA